MRFLTRVAVGSRNPVKVAAVRAVLERVQPELQLEGVDVASGATFFGEAA